MEGSLSAYLVKQGTHFQPIALPRATSDGASKTAAAVTFTVGSSPECDLPMEDAGLAPRHMTFTWDWKYSSWIVENHSDAPLYIESRCLRRGETLPLLVWETTIFSEGVLLKFHRKPDPPLFGGQPAVQFPLTKAGLMIGRGGKNKDGSNTPRLALDPAMLAISTGQAEIRKNGGDFILINHNASSSGRTILNGDQNFDERKLVLGDCIQIPNCEYYTFKFTGTSLRHLGQGGALQGIDLTVDVSHGRILHPVNLELRKGGFMGIIGGSGQGKSTLMNSLCGIVPATGGGVFVDGVQLRSPRDVAKAGIAYVPQDDIVHKDLTVEDALYYAARLRLNATLPQVKELLETTMDTLRLTEHRKKRIVNLSGGQRKRVSIASELLVGPDYIFLDEPTSGLDPQTERSLMGELSLLARHKRIGVACTTHVLQNCHVMTQLAFISRGRLIFHGKPVDAVKFFILSGSPEGAARNRLAYSSGNAGQAAPAESTASGSSFGDDGHEFTEAELLNKIANIYEIAQDTTKPVREQDRVAEGWQSEYHASPYYQPPTQDPSSVVTELPNLTAKVGALRSLLLLVSRQWKLLASSRLNYLFLVAQAVVIGLLIAWVDDNLVLQMFLGLIATLWSTRSNGAQQIVAEIAIFRRERLAGLGIHTYLLSKFLFLGAITGLQGIVLYSMLLFGSPLFHPNKKADLENAKPDFTGHVPDKGTREFRMAFFDKPWNALAEGDDTHEKPKDAPASGGPKSSAPAPDDFGIVGLDVDANNKPLANAPQQPKIVYVNPTGLHVKDSQYLLMEKIAWFFRVRDNVLDSLALHPVKLAPGESSLFAESENNSISWPLFLLNLIWLRFGALMAAALVGVALGLAVSSLVDTPTQSVMWVPLILIPQILFGSFVVIVPEMNNAVLGFSRCLPSFNLQQVMDVGLIYGRSTPRMTNQTKIAAFLANPPNEKEEVLWEGRQTNYDRISDVNKSWQNLVIVRTLLGAREKELNKNGDPRDQVEERRDVMLKKGQRFLDVSAAESAATILGGWALGCYTIAIVALYRRQTGK